ncbi:MAG: 6-bladed beta-propeller [Candidatus Omnitrophica bacterium]|nr:6-bladed beta-propeller [Candidatus Omnitrophota bacterium]
MMPMLFRYFETKAIGLTLFIAFIVILNIHKAYCFEDVSFEFEINKGFEEPLDVAVSPQGEIFVLDSRLSQVLIYDETGYYLRSIGAKGSNPGEFKYPRSITITPQNQLLVADTGNHRIQAFDEEGKFLFEFGSSGRLSGQFTSPNGVAVDNNGLIYIADSRNQRIQVFSPKGVYRYQIPLEDSPLDVAVDKENKLYILRPEAGVVTIIHSKDRRDVRCVMNRKDYLESAAGLAVDTRGNIYITETSEQSIKKFDERDILLTFGAEGRSRGQFDEPAGIFVDQEDRIYIVDTDNKRIQILKNSGNQKPLLVFNDQSVPMIDYQETIPAELALSDVQLSPNAEVFTLSQRNHMVVRHGGVNQVIGSRGREDGQFNAPAAIHYGWDNRIYVADTGNNRIQIFDQDGVFEYAFGQRGSKTGEFNAPQGVAVNSRGMIFVADSNNHRIQMFNKDGIFFRTFGRRSNAGRDEIPQDGTFETPTALAIDILDRLYVVDQGNHRIQTFDANGELISSMGGFGESVGEFNIPVDIAVDQEGFVYVADQGNHRIQVFPPTGQSPVIFGSVGVGYGQFEELSGVAVSQNQLYVTDEKSDGIRVYRFEKNFIQSKPQPKMKTPEPKKEPQKNEEPVFELR